VGRPGPGKHFHFKKLVLSFYRFTISAPSSGQTTTVDIPGRFIGIEDAPSYPGGGSVDLIVMEGGGAVLPIIQGAHYSFAVPFERVNILGVAGGGNITIIISADACSTWEYPQPPGGGGHPLADQALYIFDAEFEHSSDSHGTSVGTLADSSGNAVDADHDNGSQGTVVAGSTPNGTAAVEFPAQTTGYEYNGGVMLPLINTTGSTIEMIFATKEINNANPGGLFWNHGGASAQNSRCFIPIGSDGISCYHNNVAQLIGNASDVLTDAVWRVWALQFRDVGNSSRSYYMSKTTFRTGGFAEIGTNTNPTHIGKDSDYGGLNGWGGSGAELAFFGAWLDSTDFAGNIQYVADLIGVTLV